MHRRNRNDCRSYHSWDSCVLAASVYDRPIPWGKMVKNFEWVGVLAILATGFFSGLFILDHLFPTRLPPCGTGMPTDHCQPQPHPQSEMRWDQGYLHDFNARRPCPAVYDAPNGELRYCL